MARSSSVDKQAVFSACLTVFQSGDSVSFNRVFSLLGNKGSAKLINDLIREWRSEMGSQLALTGQRSLPGVPQVLSDKLDYLVQKLWNTALEQSESAYGDARDQLARERIDSESERDAALEKVAQAELEKLGLQGDIKALQAELTGKSEALQDALRRFGEASVALAERSEQLSQTRSDLASALATLESDRLNHAADLVQIHDRHATEIALERTRGDEKLAEAERKYQGELEREREISQGQKLHLMATTDSLRTLAKQEADSLKSQLENAKILESDLRRRASAAESESAKWYGKFELLTEQAEAERARADAAERELHTRPHAETPVDPVPETSPDARSG